MKTIRTAALATFTAVAALASLTTGCAVTRGQETVGSYIDDSTITTEVKAKFVQDNRVDASAIGVETMKGEVVLSGFAKSVDEKARAAEIALAVKGVKQVHNTLVVRTN